MDVYRTNGEWAPKIRNEWVKVMVTVEQPAPGMLAGCNRREKLERLEANARHHQEHLLQWLAEHNLSQEVQLVSEPTSFNILWAYSTPKAAQALRDAPGVISVRITDENVVRVLH